jgi:hypothetical protein
MGERYDLVLRCAYCGEWNDVWYAPTCNADTFRCDKCNKGNFVRETSFGFESIKLEDVTYRDVETGFLATTNVPWEPNKIKEMCEHRLNEIKGEMNDGKIRA